MGSSTIGSRLLSIRTERGETQEQVAEAVGISYVSLSRYEAGKRMPKMDILSRIADHFNVSVDELLGKEAPDEPAPKTLEAQIVSFGMDSLPKEEREKILSVLQAMYQNKPGLFAKGDE